MFILYLLLDFIIANLFGSWLSNTSTSVIQLYSQVAYYSFEPSATVISLVSVAAIIGQFIGAFGVPVLANKVGKKKTVIISSIFSLVVNCITLIPVHWVYLFIMRILAGMSCQMAVTVAPGWLVELCDNRNKSLLNTLFEFFISIGIMINNLLLLAVSDIASRWYIEYLYAIILSFCCLVTTLLIKNEGLTIITNKQQKQLCVKPMRRSIVNAVFMGFGSQITGICVATMYATQIFENLFDFNPYINSALGAVIMAGFKICGCLITYCFISHLGRKVMFLSGLIGAVVGNGLMALAYNFNADSQARMILVIVATGVIVVMFEFGPGLVLYIIYGEIFPGSVKNQLCGMSFGLQAGINIVLIFVFPYFNTYAWIFYIICGVFVVVCVVVVSFSQVETKNRSLEEIEREVTGGDQQVERLVGETGE